MALRTGASVIGGAPGFGNRDSHVSSFGETRIGMVSKKQQAALKIWNCNQQHAPSGTDKTRIAIEVDSLYLSVHANAGSIAVLKDCSIRVPEGQFWMLLGPNGCGKSTLLKCLAGLMRPSRGRMHVFQPQSFVFQNPDHQVVMPTAEADVAFGLGCLNLKHEEVRERVVKSLELVGMESYSQRPIQTLSGGQKQRVAIAGALAEASKVLLLDELTTFLDESDQRGVLDAVRRVVGGPRSVTCLWVTHRLEELQYADGAAYMEDGRVVLSGAAEEVMDYIELKKRKL